MVDHIHDRAYQAGRAQLNAGIDRALDKARDAIANTFRTAHEIQFAAPWKNRSKRVGCA